MLTEEEVRETRIPANEWITIFKPLLDEGHLLKISPSGLSMYPFLVGGRDEVFLRSKNTKRPAKGDIALFRRENGLYVLHRIHHIKNNEFYMLGDAQTSIEGPIKEENVIAVVDAVIRKKKKYSSNNIMLKAISNLWMMIRPLRPFFIKLKIPHRCS